MINRPSNRPDSFIMAKAVTLLAIVCGLALLFATLSPRAFGGAVTSGTQGVFTDGSGVLVSPTNLITANGIATTSNVAVAQAASLQATNNLSDVPAPATARQNLGTPWNKVIPITGTNFTASVPGALYDVSTSTNAVSVTLPSATNGGWFAVRKHDSAAGTVTVNGSRIGSAGHMEEVLCDGTSFYNRFLGGSIDSSGNFTYTTAPGGNYNIVTSGGGKLQSSGTEVTSQGNAFNGASQLCLLTAKGWVPVAANGVSNMALPEGPAMNLIFLGDSITAGVGASNYYTQKEGQLFAQNFARQCTIYDFGVSGTGASSMFTNYTSTSQFWRKWDPATRLATQTNGTQSPHGLAANTTGVATVAVINIGTNNYSAAAVATTVSFTGGSNAWSSASLVQGSALSSIAVGYNVFSGSTYLGTVASVSGGGTSGTITSATTYGVAGAGTFPGSGSLTGQSISFCPTLTQYFTDLASSVNAAKADGDSVVVETLIPNYLTASSPYWTYFNGNRLLMNAGIVQTYGNNAVSGVGLLDYASAPEFQSSNPNYLSNYSVANPGHPNDEGYRIIAREENKYLVANFSTPYQVSPFTRGSPLMQDYISDTSPTFNQVRINASAYPFLDTTGLLIGTGSAYAMPSTSGVSANLANPNLAVGNDVYVTTGVNGTYGNQQTGGLHFHYAGGNNPANYTGFFDYSESSGAFFVWGTGDAAVGANCTDNNFAFEVEANATHAATFKSDSDASVDGLLGAYNITAKTLAPPTINSITTIGSAGPATWKYKATLLMPDGTESLPSAEVTIATGNATLTSSNYISMQLTGAPALRGGIRYKVYRTLSGGTPATTGSFTGGFTSATGSTVFDQGNAGDSTSPPSSPTTGTVTAALLKVGASGTTFTNLSLGSVTLASGTATLSDATITSSTHFFPVSESSGVTGAIHVVITPGTNAVFTSETGADAGVVEYLRTN